MVRGIFTGSLWGLILGGVGLAGASMIAPQPAGNAPPAAPQVAAPQSAGVTPVEGAQPEATATADARVPAAQAPQGPAPAADALGPASLETDPAGLPNTGNVAATPDPPRVAAASGRTPGAEEPILPNPASVAPQVPASEGAVEVATTPADPPTDPPAQPATPSLQPTPEVETDAGGPVAETDLPVRPGQTPQTPTGLSGTDAVTAVLGGSPGLQPQIGNAGVGGEAGALIAPIGEPPLQVAGLIGDGTAAPTAGAALALPSAPSLPVNPDLDTGTAPAPQAPTAQGTGTDGAGPELAAPAPEGAPNVGDAAPGVGASAFTDAGVGQADSPALGTSPTVPDPGTSDLAGSQDAPVRPDAAVPVVIVDDATPPPAAPQTPVVVTIVGERTSPLPTGDTGIRVNRLGRTPTDPAAGETPVVTETAPQDDRPPLVRYAAAFDNPDGKPLVSIVLIDDGSFSGAVPALAAIPFPVTVMLAPGAPDATDRMVAYRAAGIEVGVLAQLPAGATPSDVEVFFEAAFGSLPETVAVLDAGDNGFGGGAAALGQAVATLTADQRGLVSAARGLNSALREAEKQGVPAIQIHRDLDAEGQDARVIRRFLDQAAFRARQEGAVVMMGRVRADTISALVLWGSANRAGQVALAPVSAVLLLQ